MKSDSTFNAALERICTRTGLPVISMHDLRNMCATWLFYSGVDLLRVSMFLGHKNPNTTFDIYIGHLEGSKNLRGVMDATFNSFPKLPPLLTVLSYQRKEEAMQRENNASWIGSRLSPS